MKKYLIFLLLISSLLLTACASAESSKEAQSKEAQASEETEQAEDSTAEEGAVGVDKGLFSVEITLPPSFFEGEDMDEVIAGAKEEGVGKVTENDDGSLTYKMSRAAHKEIMVEMKQSVQDTMEELTTSEDIVSIKDVTGNKDFTAFTLTVDREAYENSFDGFSIFGLGMAGMFYQIFDGVDPEKTKVEVNVKDEASGEVFHTSVFPDDLPEE